MENLNATSATVTPAVAVEEASIRPRMLRPTTRRPKMPWEVSLAEQSTLPRPPDGSAYFPYYLYGAIVPLKNGRAVL